VSFRAGFSYRAASCGPKSTAESPGFPLPDRLITRSATLFFETMADLQSALEATVAEFVADERNYTDAPSLAQISKVVE